MMKKVIEKVVTDYGVRLEIDFGSVRNNLYFNSDAELKGFVFMLHMMTSMDAASVEISVPDQEETEKGDSQEQAAPEAEDKAAEE
jgi:hypothetical protein